MRGTATGARFGAAVVGLALMACDGSEGTPSGGPGVGVLDEAVPELPQHPVPQVVVTEEAPPEALMKVERLAPDDPVVRAYRLGDEVARARIEASGLPAKDLERSGSPLFFGACSIALSRVHRDGPLHELDVADAVDWCDVEALVAVQDRISPAGWATLARSNRLTSSLYAPAWSADLEAEARAQWTRGDSRDGIIAWADALGAPLPFWQSYETELAIDPVVLERLAWSKNDAVHDYACALGAKTGPGWTCPALRRKPLAPALTADQLVACVTPEYNWSKKPCLVKLAADHPDRFAALVDEARRTGAGPLLQVAQTEDQLSNLGLWHDGDVRSAPATNVPDALRDVGRAGRFEIFDVELEQLISSVRPVLDGALVETRGHHMTGETSVVWFGGRRYELRTPPMPDRSDEFTRGEMTAMWRWQVTYLHDPKFVLVNKMLEDAGAVVRIHQSEGDQFERVYASATPEAWKRAREAGLFEPMRVFVAETE